MILYLFFLNLEHEAMLYGYKPGHQLQLAYQGRVAWNYSTPREICRHLFKMFNNDPPSDYGERSMSVGDVIVLKGLAGISAYVLEDVGFRWIDLPMKENLEFAEWSTPHEHRTP